VAQFYGPRYIAYFSRQQRRLAGCSDNERGPNESVMATAAAAVTACFLTGQVRVTYDYFY